VLKKSALRENLRVESDIKLQLDLSSGSTEGLANSYAVYKGLSDSLVLHPFTFWPSE